MSRPLIRDSFERFGNDLAANILSYLDRTHQHKYLKVSTQWFRSMFNMAHIANVYNSDSLPIIENFEVYGISSLQKTLTYVKHIEYRRAHKLLLTTGDKSLHFISEGIRKSPFVEELKIRIWDSSLDDVYMFELRDIISKAKHLKKLYLYLGFSFSKMSYFDYFVEQFAPILCELVIDNFIDIIDHKQFFIGMSKLKKLETLTLLTSTQDFEWLKKLSKAVPQLSKLYILKALDQDLRRISLNRLLELWPNIKYIFSSDRCVHPAYDLAYFKPFMKWLNKKEPLASSLYNTIYWSNELIYSRDYKFLFLARHDNNYGKLPKNIENLYFIDHCNRREENSLFQLKRILQNSPNIRALRTNHSNLDECFGYFLGKAINNPKNSYLLGDCYSDWLYCGQNLKSNSLLMIDLYSYGPVEENPKYFY